MKGLMNEFGKNIALVIGIGIGLTIIAFLSGWAIQHDYPQVAAYLNPISSALSMLSPDATDYILPVVVFVLGILGALAVLNWSGLLRQDVGK